MGTLGIRKKMKAYEREKGINSRNRGGGSVGGGGREGENLCKSGQKRVKSCEFRQSKGN